MHEEEIWAVLPDFPDYKVSNMGRVAGMYKSSLMRVHTTQYGHAKINMVDCTKQRRTRSVALLVANAFVEPEYPDCDHVIVKNMDYADLRAVNLAWRPDWFAWKYAHQFKIQAPVHYHNLRVVDVVHGLTYLNIIEAAADQGLLFHDIWRSTYTGDECYPARSIFEVIS